jgi:enamine deaminase RidA (YjgF/YER057c/UK114 family)
MYRAEASPDMLQHDHLLAPLQSAIAVELRHVRTQLEALADTLVSDVHFVAGYIDQLQAFDLLVQLTEESAALLDRVASGTPPKAAVEPVRLGIMQNRLVAALDAVER